MALSAYTKMARLKANSRDGPLTFRFQLCQDEYQIVVEVWILIQLLQSLQKMLKGRQPHTQQVDYNPSLQDQNDAEGIILIWSEQR